MTLAMTNSHELSRFQQFVRSRRAGIKDSYDAAVNGDLARQQWQGLFQRNVCAVLKALYEDSLTELRLLSLPALLKETTDSAALKEQLLKPFDGVIEEVILYALHKHRSSCALSNFDQEHNPDGDYLDTVIAIASEDWGAFVSHVDEWLTA